MSVPSITQQTVPVGVYATGSCVGNEYCAQTEYNTNGNAAQTTRSPQSACNVTMPTMSNPVSPCIYNQPACSDPSYPTEPSPASCGNNWTLQLLSCPGYGPSPGHAPPPPSFQYLCSQLDTKGNTCPSLAGVAPSAINWYQPLATKNSSEAYVQCDYDLTTLAANKEATLAWMDKFYPKNAAAFPVDGRTEQGYQTLMAAYCSAKVNNCLSGSSCSRVFEDETTNPCLQWYSDQQKAAKTDSTVAASLKNWIAQYCQANPTSDDCACYNAPQQALFRKIQSFTPSLAGCWWASCQYPNRVALVPPEDIPTTSCADDCINVVQFLEKNNISQSEINQYLSCGAKPSPSPSPNNGPSSGPSAPSHLWIWITGAVVGFILVIALILLLR